MRPQVNAVSRSCLYQLRKIRAFRRLTDKATNTLIVALVSSRLDYCNSIYFGSSDFVFSKLQSVMNATARPLAERRRCDHILPVLKDLHWLYAQGWVTFKLATLVFDCLQRTQREIGPHFVKSPIISQISQPLRSCHSQNKNT